MDQAIRIPDIISFTLADGSNHFEGTSVFISITDSKGKEVFRKTFESSENCQEFVDTYCISFQGAALFNYQHPLVEIFKGKVEALRACNEGYLTVNAHKEIVTILEPSKSPQYSDEWVNFKARITVEKIITHVYTRYNQFFTQQLQATSSIPSKTYEGVLNKTTRYFVCNF